MAETHVYKEICGRRFCLDVHRTGNGANPAPAVIWIHGGALREGDRTECGHGFRYTRRGYSVISIDYRLAPETKLPEIVEDVRDALDWVRDHLPTAANIDPDRIGMVGHSAGGYLSLMAGTFSEPPQAIVSYYGYGDIASSWFSDNLEVLIDPESVQDLVPYCPERNVNESYPPTMLLHGTDDTNVPYRLSVQMAHALERAGVDHSLITILNGEHGFDGIRPVDQSEATKRAIEDMLYFLDSHV